MKGTSENGPIEWLIFEGGEKDGVTEAWQIHIPFMMSSWECLFGRGCPGHFGKQSSVVNPDAGCCGHGAFWTEKDDYEHIRKMIPLLTDDDWDIELQQHVNSLHDKDPLIIRSMKEAVYSDTELNVGNTPLLLDAENYRGKTRVHDGVCVFSNRNNGSTGKPGCAFHALAQRTGQSHVDTMPRVCWMLPIRMSFDADTMCNIIHPWDADEWGGEDYDDDNNPTGHDSYMSWWCVDTPDAYCHGDKPLYQNMEEELRNLMGDGNYDIMVGHLEAKMRANGWTTNRPAMPILVEQGLRPSLPLFIGNRTDNREGPLKAAGYVHPEPRPCPPQEG